MEALSMLNVPKLLMEQALAITPKNSAIKKFAETVDAGKELLILGEFYKSTEYALALANAWAIENVKDTVYLSATDWDRYSRKNKAPCNPFETFTEFLRAPVLVLAGLSYVGYPRARQEIDVAMHRRTLAGKVNVITGWNMPTQTFRFEPNQELAHDSNSEYPMLHERSGLKERMAFMEVPNG
jgi:hypothetical protein